MAHLMLTFEDTYRYIWTEIKFKLVTMIYKRRLILMGLIYAFYLAADAQHLEVDGKPKLL